DVYWASGSTCYLEQARSKGIQVIEHDLVLNANVAVSNFVEPGSEMSEDRSGVHTLVDSQQRHTHARRIIRCQRPEASVCVPVLGTDPRMKDKRPGARDRKNTFGENVLAQRDNEVGRRRLDELLAFS